MRTILRPPLQARANSGITFRPDANTALWLPGQDDAFSSTIRDRSGNGNNGTITGASWKRNDQGTWYLDFNGTSNLVALDGLVSVVSGYDVGSVVLWILPGSDTGTTSIMGISNATEGSSEFSIARENGNKRIDISPRENSTSLMTAHSGSNSCLDDTWIQFVYTVDGSGNIWYIDGSAVTPTYSTGNAASHIFFNDIGDTDSFRIGNNIDSSGEQFFFKGGLALERVYSVKLSASQVAGIYNQERQFFRI